MKVGDLVRVRTDRSLMPRTHRGKMGICVGIRESGMLIVALSDGTRPHFFPPTQLEQVNESR